MAEIKDENMKQFIERYGEDFKQALGYDIRTDTLSEYMSDINAFIKEVYSTEGANVSYSSHIVNDFQKYLGELFKGKVDEIETTKKSKEEYIKDGILSFDKAVDSFMKHGKTVRNGKPHLKSTLGEEEYALRDALMEQIVELENMAFVIDAKTKQIVMEKGNLVLEEDKEILTDDVESMIGEQIYNGKINGEALSHYADVAFDVDDIIASIKEDEEPSIDDKQENAGKEEKMASNTENETVKSDEKVEEIVEDVNVQRSQDDVNKISDDIAKANQTDRKIAEVRTQIDEAFEKGENAKIQKLISKRNKLEKEFLDISDGILDMASKMNYPGVKEEYELRTQKLREEIGSRDDSKQIGEVEYTEEVMANEDDVKPEEEKVMYSYEAEDEKEEKTEETSEESIDTSEVDDIEKDDDIDVEITSDSLNKYKEINENINKEITAIEKDLNKYLIQYAKKNKIKLEGETISDKINFLYDALADDEKEKFAKDINPKLAEVKKKKEKVAAMYKQSLKAGKELLKESEKKIKEAEAEKEKLVSKITDATSINEKIEKLSSLIEEKEKLAKEAEKDGRFPDAQALYEEIGKLSNEKDTLSKDLTRSLNGSTLEELRNKLEESTTKIESMKKEYETSKDEYLKNAEEVRGKLYTKGIKLDIEGRSDIPFDDLEEAKETAQQTNLESAGTANAVAKAAQASTQTVQAPQPQQVVSQTLPISNVNNRDLLDQSVYAIIGDGNIWHDMVNPNRYSSVIKNFEAISQNPASLSASQKRQIRNAFRRSAKAATNEMKNIDEAALSVIEKVIGKDNFDIIKDEITGNGKFLSNPNNGFRGLDKETKDAIISSANECYAKIQRGELSQSEIAALDNSLLKQLRFATAERNCGKVTGNRVVDFFANKKDDKYAQDLGDTLYNISTEFVRNGYYVDASQQVAQPSYEEQNISDRQVENDKKSFAMALNDLVKTDEEIDWNKKIISKVEEKNIGSKNQGKGAR